MQDWLFSVILTIGLVDFVLTPIPSTTQSPEPTLKTDLRRAMGHWLAIGLISLLFLEIAYALWIPPVLAVCFFYLDQLRQRLWLNRWCATGLVVTQLAKIILPAAISLVALQDATWTTSVFLTKVASTVPLAHVSSFRQVLSTATVYLYVVFGGAILVRCLLNRFQTSSSSKMDLSRAGELIGMLERLLLLTFVLLQSYSAIAFVVTAKSIARYDRISKEQDFAEYYLVGTLASASVAILGGVLLSYLYTIY